MAEGALESTLIPGLTVRKEAAREGCLKAGTQRMAVDLAPTQAWLKGSGAGSRIHCVPGLVRREGGEGRAPI